jgi:mycofactocin precursor
MSPSPATDLLERDRTDADQELVDADDELLVEEISIDGMCGVY